MPRGGARKGAGKPKGHKLTDSRKDFLKFKRETEKAYHTKVLRMADRIFQNQARLANGCSYLYRIELDGDGKKKKPELVTSKSEIEDYLAGDVDDLSVYHYITTDKPDNRAMDSMMDRVLGKATQKLEHTGEDGGPIQIDGINMVNPNGDE